MQDLAENPDIFQHQIALPVLHVGLRSQANSITHISDNLEIEGFLGFLKS